MDYSIIVVNDDPDFARYLHSSPSVTMRYLGIQDKEVHETLMNEIG